jgi:hypothetical protein
VTEVALAGDVVSSTYDAHATPNGLAVGITNVCQPRNAAAISVAGIGSIIVMAQHHGVNLSAPQIGAEMARGAKNLHRPLVDDR